jgi:REP element-mobilizing transposase RayT
VYRRRPWRRVCAKSRSESRILPMNTEGSLRSRGYLPHWEKDEEIYFVTFRLADSLPREILQKIVAERADIPQRAAQMRRDISRTEKRKLKVFYSKKVSKYLDAGRGRCILSDPRAARIVRDVLFRFDGLRYDLIAWCIMPNHVHVVFHMRDEWKLERILHGWKSYSTNRIQRALLHRGSVWQREYYDHVVRHQGELVRVVRYVAENPIRAGLKDWPWVGVHLK